jgi:protease II
MAKKTGPVLKRTKKERHKLYPSFKGRIKKKDAAPPLHKANRAVGRRAENYKESRGERQFEADCHAHVAWWANSTETPESVIRV